MIQVRACVATFYVLLLTAVAVNHAFGDETRGPGLPTLEDELYKTACGPIASYVALHSLGKSVSLDDVVRRCEWVPERFTKLGEMQAALSSVAGIECMAVEISPQQLCSLLKDDNTVAILPVRKTSEKTDHAFCVVEVRDDGQMVKLIDYPELVSWKMIGELAQQWDGPALVVRTSLARRTQRRLLYFLMPIVTTVIVLLWSRDSIQQFLKRKFPSGSSAQAETKTP